MIAYLQNPFVLLGVANAVLFGVLLGWSLQKPTVFFRYAFLLAFMLATLWASITPRTQISGPLDLHSTGKESWQWVMNFQELLVALVIVFIFLLGISGRLHLTRNIKMTITILILFAATSAIGTAFTPEADWSRGLLIPTAFMVAVLMYSASSIEILPRYIIFGLSLVVVGSLISLVVHPEWAMSGRGDGLFNLDGRLLGLTRHPNTLGYLAVLLIILTWWSVTSFRLALILVSSSLIVLLLTVSRTAWVAAIVVFSIWIVFHYIPKMTTGLRIQTSFLILGFVATGVIAGVWFGFIDLEDRVFSGAATLTGRTTVWHLSWELWKGSPLVGYGTDAWSNEWRYQFGLSWAGQAHNQFFDTLVTSGLLGVFVLISYLFLLVRLALNKAEVSNGASIALVAVLFIHGITESPLGSMHLDQMFFAHLIILIMLLLPENSPSKNPNQKQFR